MKYLFLVIISLVMISCEEEEEGKIIACAPATVQGEVSGLSYVTSELKEGEASSLQADQEIENGKRTYALESFCFEGELFNKESIVGISCDSDFSFNEEGGFCESNNTVFYSSRHLAPNGSLRVLDLDNNLDQSGSNTFRVLIDDVESFLSDVATEVGAGKIELNKYLDRTLNILSGDYTFSAAEGALICFELGSENRAHCFNKNSAAKSSQTELLSSVYDGDISLDLLDESQFEEISFRGNVDFINGNFLGEDQETVALDYVELNHSGLIFDLQFSLENTKSYRLEIEANGTDEDSTVEVVIYRKSDFQASNLQDGYLKKFNIGFTDSSQRRKRLTFDFTASVNEQAEELVVLIYGENQAYVRDFRLSSETSTSAKNLSLFLTSTPNRSFGMLNYVPDQYAPFGIPGAIGYGSFQVDEDEADYEIYTNYNDQYKTTGTHLYAKNDSNHDADLSLNFRGVSNSAPGGDSSSYLYGTRALDVGYALEWSELKADPAVGLVVLHAEGGRFALDGNFLKPYSSFSDETSVGGELESDTLTRFNNRIGKRLDNRVLNEQNTNDPMAPLKDPLDLSNNSLTYFPDLQGRVFVEDDNMGGTQLNAAGISAGYDLFTEFLFYLFDDQGPVWDAGGPEGAIAGTFIEQESFEDFLSDCSCEAGLDSDLDGVSNYVEYITGKDPLNAGSMPFLDAYDLFDDEGGSFKAVTFDFSKKALNFGINVYQTRTNGVESLVWSFDRGRGFEASNLVDVAESETSVSITVLAEGGALEISNMRVEFN